jgi:zinc/manganese transport system substrate-binding protein
MMLRRQFVAAAPPFAVLPALAQARLRVVATFSILGDLVHEIGSDRIELAVLVGADADAHTYQPKPTDARALASAQALVSNGLAYEGWIDRLAKAAPFKGRAIVATTGVATLQGAPSPGHSHAHGPDPHCWQDVGRVRRYVGNIVEGLAAADAANATFYRERGQAYDKRLAALDQWIKAEIAKVPAAQRRAITAHDSFRYFTAAYGVQFLAPRGFTTESEPSAKDVAALIRQVREQKIKALFVENMSNPGLIDQIARESGAVVGPRLYSDALSGPGGPAPTYEAMMRHNVAALVAGMMKN